MNWYFVSAAALAFTIGLVHSLLGERLIFRRMRTAGIVPTNGGQVLREPQVRILWASWHVVTLMGWCVGVFLLWLAVPSSRLLGQSSIVTAVAVTMLGSSILVLFGTRGRHAGWVGLLGVAILTILGSYA
jgi:hypothetical protein